jgi:hypothetical protein
MFGCAPKVGLSTTPILNEILRVLSEGLSFKCACKSSSFSRNGSISFGIGVVDRPTLAYHEQLLVLATTPLGL